MATAVVTILFTDLIGSTELFRTLGEQGAQRLRNDHFALLRSCVAAHGGREVKTIGDSLMVAFDSPTAAVACAIDMQQRVDRHGRRIRRHLRLRIGLNAGEATREEGDYFGTSVVVAKRLCDVATRGQILAPGWVRTLVGTDRGFRFQDLSPLKVKGLEDPVPLCEITWERTTDPPPLPAPIATIAGPPFVGRDDEFARLRSASARARTGERVLVTIAGEPGIGKSRLAAEFGREVHRDGSPVLYGRCDDGSVVPFQPFIEALRRYVATADPQMLVHQLGPTGGDLVPLIPELDAVVPDLPPRPDADPQTQRFRLFEAIADALTAVGGNAPAAVIIDDLHWANAPTLEMLKHLIRHRGPGGLVLVGTYREDDLSRTHPLSRVLQQFRDGAGAERILMRGLGRDEIRALVEASAPARSAVALADPLHRKTEGNPLFVQEIVRHLHEIGALTADAGGASAIDEMGLPEGIREVIGRRLARLTEDCNETLRIAAVIGSVFPLEVLRPLAPDRGIDEAVKQGLEARVIQAVPDDESRLSFTHALVRETLESELATSRRVRLHGRVGAIMEELYADDPPLAELAYHFHEAAAVVGQERKGISYARRAAEQALAFLAYEEAELHLTRALDMLDLVDADDPELRADLLLDLAGAQQRSGNPEATKVTTRAAAAVIRTLDDPERLARAALGYAPMWAELGVVDPFLVELLEETIATLPQTATALRSRAHARLAIESSFLLDSATAVEQSAVAVAIAREADDPTLGYALAARRLALTGPAYLDERLTLTAETIEVAERAKDFELLQRARSIRTTDLMQAGDIEGYERTVSAFRATAAELRQPVFGFFGDLVNVGDLIRRGALGEARARLDRLLPRTGELGLGVAHLAALGLLHTVNWLSGKVHESWEMVRPIVDAAGTLIPPLALFTAEAHLHVGDTEGAREIYDRVIDDALAAPPTTWLWSSRMVEPSIALGDEERWPRIFDHFAPYAGQHLTVGPTVALVYAGPVIWGLGRLDHAMGRLDDAIAKLERGVDAARTMRARSFVPRIQTHLAEALLDRGRHDDQERAGALLREVIEVATALGVVSVLREARTAIVRA